MNRRDLLTSSVALLGSAVLLKHGLVRAQEYPRRSRRGRGARGVPCLAW
jgi:hypothetical protein